MSVGKWHVWRELKIDEAAFDAVFDMVRSFEAWDSGKLEAHLTFERTREMGFGDRVMLRRWNPLTASHNGQVIVGRIVSTMVVDMVRLVDLYAFTADDVARMNDRTEQDEIARIKSTEQRAATEPATEKKEEH